ncbi:MAG TPA: TerD family protein [Verrucomicrobiae bacterium]|nr:TerD family protein [Verrucomicrobiae bacterium]
MDTVSLEKGENVNLSKMVADAGGTLTKVSVRAGWDAKSVNTTGPGFDIDISAFVLDKDRKILSQDPRWFIYFKNLDSPDGSVHHHGDNLTGAGDDDDEIIDVNLDQLPTIAQRSVFSATVFEAVKRSHNFGNMQNAFVRVLDDSTGIELVRYDLTEDYASAIGLVVGELYLHDGDWKFRAKGDVYPAGLAGLCAEHGVAVK